MLLKIYQYIRGYVRIRITGHRMERFINACNYRKIKIWDLSASDGSYEMNLWVKDFKKLRHISQMCIRDRAGADIIMLDNMSYDEMKEALLIIDGRAETECSGNVTKENIEKLTGLGVDYISSGALTHSAPILDISLKGLHAI